MAPHPTRHQTDDDEPDLPRKLPDNWSRAFAVSYAITALLLTIIGYLVNRGIDTILAEQSLTRAREVDIEHRVTEGAKDNQRDDARLTKLEAAVKDLQQVIGMRR